MSYPDIPKLKDSLFSRDFQIRINEEVIYEGKFYSAVSSMSYPGIVILDSLWKMDNQHNTIQIDFGYPAASFSQGEDHRSNPEIMDYLESKGLLQ